MSEAHRTPLHRYAALPGDPAPLRRDLALLRAKDEPAPDNDDQADLPEWNPR